MEGYFPIQNLDCQQNLYNITFIWDKKFFLSLILERHSDCGYLDVY